MLLCADVSPKAALALSNNTFYGIVELRDVPAQLEVSIVWASERFGLLRESVERVLMHLSKRCTAFYDELEVFDQVVDTLASVADVFFVA